MADTPVTFINVFELPADQVDTFAEGWRERERFMSTMPGFRDSTLHRAVSGDARFQVVNVAHWDSADAFRAATAHPEFRELIRKVATDPNVKVTANPALYEVAVTSE